MEKLLFVINTMGRAGAEVSFLNLLYEMPGDYDIDLLVLMGQGEMYSDIPENVHIINKKIDRTPVNSEAGERVLKKTVERSLFFKGGLFKDGGYMFKNYRLMKKSGQVRRDKLLWRAMSDTAPVIQKEYDLAVAFIEGGSAYYVADHVKARTKAAFIHIDYEKAGYSKELDLDAYAKFDRIFCVSEEVRTGFLKVYPELYPQTDIFKNILNADLIRKKAEEEVDFAASAARFFDPEYKGLRILTIGRLTSQKNWETSILAAGLLKRKGLDFIWLLLGEGEERGKLIGKIKAADVEDRFFLPGAVSNPYPYIKKADIYAHCSAFEGKSVAVQEARILGKPLVISDVPGNREQVVNNKDGLLVHFKANRIADGILALAEDTDLRNRLAKATLTEAGQEFSKENTDIKKLLGLLSD